MMHLGIVGHPLSHTLSPVLHRFLLASLGLDGEYLALPTPPECLETTLFECREKGFRGLNVTIPHKVRVLDMLLAEKQPITDAAKQAQAINTLRFESDGKIVGHNTDIHGFLEGIPEKRRRELSGQSILLLGAGGAARAVLAGLLQEGATQIAMAVRSPEKAAPLAEFVAAFRKDGSVHCKVIPFKLISWDALTDLSAYQLLIHTTPIGMYPHIDETPVSQPLLETFPKTGFIYDLIYRPEETRLLQTARHLGIEGCSGLPMLLHQGVAAFEFWTGEKVPADVLHDAGSLLHAALEKN